MIPPHDSHRKYGCSASPFPQRPTLPEHQRSQGRHSQPQPHTDLQQRHQRQDRECRQPPNNQSQRRNSHRVSTAVTTASTNDQRLGRKRPVLGEAVMTR